MINSIGCKRMVNCTMGQDNKQIDNEIKFLEKRKSNIEEQISKIKVKNISEQTKQGLIKPLREQIQQIDVQIQQKRMQKINKASNNKENKKAEKANDNKINNNTNRQNNNMSKDSLLLDLDNVYRNMKTGRHIITSLKASSNTLKQEAKLDLQRGKFKIAQKKFDKANEYEVGINKVDSKFCKNINKVNKKIKKMNNIKTSKDEHSKIVKYNNNEKNDITKTDDSIYQNTSVQKENIKTKKVLIDALA